MFQAALPFYFRLMYMLDVDDLVSGRRRAEATEPADHRFQKCDPRFGKLPRDLLKAVFALLDDRDVASQVGLVCHSWRVTRDECLACASFLRQRVPMPEFSPF